MLNECFKRQESENDYHNLHTSVSISIAATLSRQCKSCENKAQHYAIKPLRVTYMDYTNIS